MNDERDTPEPLEGCRNLLVMLGVLFIIMASIVAFLLVVEARGGR